MDSIIFAPAHELAKAIRCRSVSAVEVLNAHLDHLSMLNPQINALVQLNAHQAQQAALAADQALAKNVQVGPLHGVPFTAKDSFDTQGIRSTAGTQGRTDYIPSSDATVVIRMKQAGAILLGKSNLSELALTFESDNLVYGRTSNPYDLSLSAGGSSGGEAALIAAGGSPLGLGSDAGGSIRLPAHYCGIAGLKPTPGRIPTIGHVPAIEGPLSSIATCGPMARSVADLRLALSILEDHQSTPITTPRSIQDLRLAVCFEISPATPDAATIKTVQQVADMLTKTGLNIQEAQPQRIEHTLTTFLGLMGADGGAGIKQLLKYFGTTDLHPATAGFLGAIEHQRLSEAALFELLQQREAMQHAVEQFFTRYDALICPVNAYPALPHATTHEHLPAFVYTMFANLLGLPAVTVRGGTSPDGLPIGVQIITPPHHEELALTLAEIVEQAYGGWQAPPLVA